MKADAFRREGAEKRILLQFDNGAVFMGICTGEDSRLDAYRPIRAEVVCLDGARAYAGGNRAPYLTVWADGKRLPDPPQPPLPVRALFVVGDRLYCGHESAPFVSAYRIAGDTLSPEQALVLSAYSTDQVVRYGERGVALNLQGDTLREYVPVRRDLAVIDFIERTFQYVPLGRFAAGKPERKNDVAIQVEAYDRMTRFDRPLDGWVNSLPSPITAGDMLRRLCAYCGVPCAVTSFLNDGFLVHKNFKGINLTGRQVLQWLAELAASFARIDPQGRCRCAPGR